MSSKKYWDTNSNKTSKIKTYENKKIKQINSKITFSASNKNKNIWNKKKLSSKYNLDKN